MSMSFNRMIDGSVNDDQGSHDGGAVLPAV